MVVLGDPGRPKDERLLRAIGRAVDRLGGRFVVSEDVGTSPEDMAVVARETTWVNRSAGGFPDTAGTTARAVLVGIRTAVRRRLGRSELEGLTVAVQGLGQVGRSLCGHLAGAGARLVVADLDGRAAEDIVRRTGATAVAPEAIFDQPVDVFAPCALGDAIDARTAPRLRCKVVAGSANNQLADPDLAAALAARGILYAPDFVINAGGVIGAATGGGDEAALRARLDGIGALLEAVFERAERERTSTHAAAEAIARERLRAMGVAP